MRINMKYMKHFFFAIAVAVIAYFSWGYFFPVAQMDFFECGANNTLVACPVGETPKADVYGDCRSVGDGDTTLTAGDCS